MLRACVFSTWRSHSRKRGLSTAANNTLSPHHSIYVSNSSNPYFNLSLEDWLFRHKNHKEPLLLIYRDVPCVVIGRNQNPWKEVNMVASRTTGVPWIRRRSGGGTVYHDLGNTNFSIHLPRSSFDRHATAQVVLRAVRSLGVDANINDRNDICVGKDKVSGSAYKIVNNRAYHHGTMLISTRLDVLGDLLRSNKPTMETRGVASVRSPVCNLQQYEPSVSHEGFVEAVIDSFRQEYNIEDSTHTVEENVNTLGIDYIHKGMEELPRWDWAFGQTPEFTYNISRTFDWGTVTARIRSKHGIILNCSFELPDGHQSISDDLVQDQSRQLEGQRYGFLDETKEGIQRMMEGPGAEIWQWLKMEMDT
ncbi:unnamed protein product [Somion occarium]|uniref:Putative lipoate-protein ligase A n=1 Tax=Somion occarium TaxID=3059160 RepID=A0ABP1CXB8_9APHY